MADKISLDRIKKLHPIIREEAKLIFAYCEASLTGRAAIRITQGLRTIEEQNELYAQGRTKPGKIVTNARGGSSYHNYGLAVDFTLVIDGHTISWDMTKDWDDDRKADWFEVVQVFKEYEWKWGGNFKTFRDYPHFQKTLGYSIADLRIKWKKQDTFIQNGIEYVNL